jgi:hypothetical protein
LGHQICAETVLFFDRTQLLGCPSVESLGRAPNIFASGAVLPGLRPLYHFAIEAAHKELRLAADRGFKTHRAN